MKRFSKRVRFMIAAIFTCVMAATFCLAACSSNSTGGGLTLEPDTLIMHVGEEPKVLTASGEDKNGKAFSSSDYSWSSEGDAIAISKVGYLCEVTALKPGTGTVTVKAGKFSAWCDVVVLDTVETVTLDKSTLELSVGESDTLTAEVTLTLGGAYSGSYEWSVTKGEDIIGISPSGNTCTVTAKATGDATITVTVEDFSVECAVKVRETSENEHSYSQESEVSWSWTGSNEEGWTATATVKCDYCDYTVDAVVEMTTETTRATCTDAGKTVYTATAKLEGEAYEWKTSKEVSIPATGHTYPDPSENYGEEKAYIVWEWASRSAETVNLKLYCVECKELIETIAVPYTADTSDANLLSASATAGGYTYSDTYDASGEGEAEHTHNYTITSWNWSEDYTSCTVTAQCVAVVGDCDEKTCTYDATVSSETTEPTCVEAGKIVYTAKVTINGVEYSDTKEQVLNATGEHVFSNESEVSWSWTESDEEGWTATATVKCDNCSYTENLDVAVSKDETSATCTEKGKIVYTAVAKVGDGIEYTDKKEVEIPATGHTYPENGDVENVLWDWENISGGKVEVVIKCTVCGEVIASEKISYSEDENNPGYWVAEVGVDGYTYSGSYKYTEAGESEETSDTIVEVNFDSERFTSGTVYVQKKDDEHPDTPTSASLTYNDGTETGFTAVGEASDSSTIEIATAKASDGSHTILKFNGGASTTKGSISIGLQQGYYCVVLTYFQSNAGRWATVLDSEGEDLAPYIAEEDKTTSDSSQKTRTIYFHLDSAQNVYIGSHENGLYVTSIGIYGVESVVEMIVEGVSLDVSEAEIVEGEEIVLTALVKLSDGKTYKGYDLVEYTWTSEPEGYVPENYTSDNITISGQGIGTVKVTVSVVVGSNVYSDNCVITVTEKVEEEIPELGEKIEEIYIDFSVESTYSWIENVVSGNAYTSGIMTFYTGTGSNMSISNGYLNTYGGSSTGNGRYFTIDLSGYEGRYITINVSFTGNGTSERYLILATGLVSDITTNPGAVLTSVKTTSTGTMYTLSFSGTITADMATLYLTCSNGMRIYSVSVDVFEIVENSEPRVTGLTLTSTASVVNVGGDPITIEAIVKMNKGSYEGTYIWSLSEGWEQVFETDYSAGATDANTLTLTPKAAGTVTITVTLEDETSATCTLIVLEEGEDVTELITSTFDYSIPASIYGTSSSTDEEYTQGIFTVDSGVRFESSDINTQGNCGITIEISGQDASISFTGTGASGNATISVTLLKNGDDVTPEEWASVNLAESSSYNFTVSGLDAGTYKIVTSASVRIYSLTVSQYLPVSNPTGIVMTASSVDFLKGRTVSVNDFGLEITLVYENGREDSLIVSEVEIAMPSELSVGRHEVTVTYRYDKNGLQRDFSDTFYIYIYSIDSITISDFSMEYTSGTYYTNNVQKIFLVGSSINYDYAAVTATASCTYYDEDSEGYVTVYYDFILNSDEVSFSDDANMYVAGEYTVTATANMGETEGTAKTATYQINVVSKEGADITTVKVNQTENVSMDENGVYTVNTINDAIMLIKLLGATDEERKFIYVDEGTYEEKIYIDIPNLSLIGSNPTENESGESLLATRSENTEIVFWAMNGLMDPSGSTTYSTVGSATVTIAEQATGFYAENITFRNYWNTNDLYNEALDVTGSTQADAAYVNADGVYFYNVTFTGYHDTLEAENGRQVYDHCYIEGRTDYIFGATATCYFKDCTIHSIGAGTSQSNGGYVVAYKGTGNKGTVDYGYIFDGCTFEGDENVKEHSVALGRAWDQYMMMVVMNCTFDNSFSMIGYTGASSAIRYCQMNAEPNFTRIYEYNNQGGSAVTVDGENFIEAYNGLVTDADGNSLFTIPSDEKAKDFADMSVIFAATNGTVNYGSAWDGKCDVIKITVHNGEETFTIYGTGSMSASEIKKAVNARLEDADVDKIYTNLDMTEELTGSISGSTDVYISIGEKDMTVPESASYNFQGTEYGEITENGWLDYMYFEVADGGYFKSNGSGWYLLYNATITVKLSAGSSIEFEVYSENSISVDKSESEIVTVEVKEAVEGESNWFYKYTVSEKAELTFSANGQLCIRNIVITVPIIYEIGDYIDFTDIPSDFTAIQSGSTGVYKGVEIYTTSDAGKFGYNSSGTVQVNAGTTLKIPSVQGATAEIKYFSGQAVSDTIITPAGSDGYITIEFVSNTYVDGIWVVESEDLGSEDIPEVPEDVYEGKIIFNPEKLEIEDGKEGTVDFEIEITLNGEAYTGNYDITVEADDTNVAVESWDLTESKITVKGINAGETTINIVVKVDGVTIIDAKYSVVVTAPEKSGEEEEEGLPGVHMDFGDSETYSWIKTTSVTYTKEGSETQYDNAITDEGNPSTSSNGLLTIVGTSSPTSNEPMRVESGYLTTAGATQSAGRYFQINLSDYIGKNVSIVVSFCSGKDKDERYVILSTSKSTKSETAEGVIDSKSCSSSSVPSEFNFKTLITEEYSTLYLTFSANIRIYSIDIEIYEGGDSKEGDSGSDSEIDEKYPDPNDTVHVVWDWEGRNEESQTVTVTIYSVEGELLTTETTAYNVDVNNPSYWYAEVSAGGITYASMYKIPGEGDAYSEKSFIVPLAGSLEGISTQSFAENEQIEDNELFTITAGVSLKYSGGTVSSKSTDGDANAEYGALQKGSNAISFTDMNGVVHNPDQGIVMSSAFTEKQDINNIITITAKEDVTLYVYVVFTNSSFNSDKKGNVYCTVNDGEKIGEEELSSRTALWSYGVNGISLAKGDVLVIGAEDSNGDKANFWFFGAEACTEGEKINYADVKTVIFCTNQTSISTISKAVYNYSVVSAPVLPNVSGQYFVGWYMDASCNVAYDFSEPVTSDLTLYAKWVTMDSEITYIQGTYESISLEFADSNPSGAKIMYKAIYESSYTVMTDVDAIRLVGDTTVRVDIMGLQGDTYYNVKVLTSGNEQLAEYKIYVSSYDRSGYAHFNYSDGVGAYEDDGTLKDGALVIYVTEENKNDVTNDIYKYSKDNDTYTKVEWSELSQYLKMTDSGDLANYNRFAGTSYDGYVKGIGEILNNSRYSSTGRKNVGIAALCSAYGAVDVRIVGEVTASLVSGEVYWGYDDEEKTDRWMVWGTYDIYGLSDLNPKADAESADVNGGSHGDDGGLVLMRDAYNLTIEGVGEGAVLNGWGVTFMTTEANTDENIKTGKSFEVRNLTFVNYPEDAIGIQGTQQTVNSDKTQSYLTASAERIWVHNNTFYAGYCEYPAESDKGEGDGTCDFKRGQYFTLSYNYFEGCHKTDLFGADNNNLQFNISMHHNFWHNCQSRIPMTRNSNIHYYNNYVLVDDTTNIQYVMDARADAYIYAEYNYFEGCVDVFRSSDGTGTIKSYGNELVNCTTTSNTQNITPTNAETREENVENSCGYWHYGIDYSSFDTDSTLFYYDAAKGRSDCYLTSAEEAKEEVIRTAGALSRDKFTSCEQYVKAADIVKPTAPEFDLELESPDEDDDTSVKNSAGISAYVIPYTESTKRYA